MTERTSLVGKQLFVKTITLEVEFNDDIMIDLHIINVESIFSPLLCIPNYGPNESKSHVIALSMIDWGRYFSNKINSYNIV